MKIRQDRMGVSFYPFLIIAVGILLRLKSYFENRSVWVDEAYVALGLATRSLKSILLFEPFAMDLPSQPPGFLIVEKLIVLFGGTSEYTACLYPQMPTACTQLCCQSQPARLCTQKNTKHL